MRSRFTSASSVWRVLAPVVLHLPTKRLPGLYGGAHSGWVLQRTLVGEDNNAPLRL
jgi:hypothetical protein